ncbi:sugar ABC transporter ATP-binding protein [Roseisalinus antarcticus]|uniref:Galactose/methyl galactoside import ATP-binding protein MglA n=1 Tax=Roseisalinus antarcticus TaxID=254357 RepID=A0A1Y5TKY3_9RHOB|nr:sugar ABC transporter ATP-binding protein [Roseisalinus antarcticus]SLN64475.1 Galactose/methyl galactoside import ATP-binding protein MglA [Roseisalinus antarcticus]
MLLTMQGIDKSFGPNKVLDQVNFDVDEAEIVALLGANGAGKSTLMKIMTGIYGKDAGKMAIAGKVVDIREPTDAMRNGIRLVPQELQVLRDLSVAENIFLGAIPASGDKPLSRINRSELNRRAREILADLGLDDMDVTAPLSRFSISRQRLVEIARALAGDARILVMDEPTASLSAPECAQLFAIMRRLKTRGVSIIFISHFLDQVFEICDRIEVLRDGANAGTFVTAETTHHDVLTAMLGRELSDLFPPFAAAPGEIAFRAEALQAPPRIDRVSFAVRKGEIHGVFGLIGSGIEELGKLLFGIQAPQSGRLELFGKPFAPRSVPEAIGAGVGFVSGERKSEGIVPDMTLRDNVTLPYLGRHTTGPRMSVASQTTYARKWIDALGVRTEGAEQKISGLSGGNQQKICIGRWLVDDLRVLILEEPTRGVDLGARKDIYAHLRRLSDAGLSIIVISSDAEEIGGLADTSSVLIAGSVAATFDAPTDATTLMATATRSAAA